MQAIINLCTINTRHWGTHLGEHHQGMYLLQGRLHVCYSLETSKATGNKALLTMLFEEPFIIQYPQES